MRGRLAVLVAVALGLAACTNSTAAGLSRSEVRAIVQTYSRDNNRANETLSVRLQNEDEQGPAAAIDDANFVLDARAGFVTVSGAHYQPFFEHLDASVPGTTSRYPKTLITIDTPYTTSLKRASRVCRFAGIFVKDSATSPWRVAHEPTVARGGLPRVVAHASGGQSRPLVVSLGGLPRYYAIAFTTYFQEGVLSRGIARSVFRGNASCWSLPNLRQDPFLASGGSSQVITATTVTPDHPDQVSFSTADGGELSFFGLRVDVVSNALGTVTFAWSHQHGQPVTFLLPVARGLKQVKIPLEFDLAVFDPPAGAGQLAPRIVGSYWGPLIDASASVKPVSAV